MSRRIKKIGFWRSLDDYVVKKIFSLGCKWEFIGIFIAGLSITTSLITTNYFTSPTLTGSLMTVISGAVKVGDYQTAQTLYELTPKNVLGRSLEWEELVYPDLKIQREIQQQKQLLSQYPQSRDVMMALAKLYDLAEKKDLSQKYLRMAKKLQPN